MNSTMSKSAQAAGKPPFRAINFAEPTVLRENRADGSTVLRAAQPLRAYDPNLARLFRRAVETQPDRLLMAERDSAGAWAGVTYAQARRKADAVAQALIDRGLTAERPVMALSGNAVEHGLLTLACYTAGIPIPGHKFMLT